MLANEMHELAVRLSVAGRGSLKRPADRRLTYSGHFCQLLLGAALLVEEVANLPGVVRLMQ